jgi:outer membrane protein OmpA-like peptidoglycan-associated protein
MKKTIGLVAAALLGTVSAAAFADPTIGPYGTVAAGASFYEDVTPTLESGSLGNVATTTTFKTGYRATAAAGWGWGNGLRTEAEFGYSAADVDHGFLSNDGRASQFTLMGNAIYDFDTGTPWTPHVGIGLGVGFDRVGGVNFPAGVQTIDTSSTTFAWQGIAGLEYAIAPQLRVGVDYRYIGGGDIEVASASNIAPHAASFDLSSHNVMVTLRLDFEAPPAPPAPVAPPPAPLPPPPPPPHVEAQRSFQVFFDFNKSDITAAAAKVIQAASDNVKAGNVTQIVVTGHTDTVGSAQYNQGLSERRAASVKKQLIADGIGADNITTRGVGKTGLLVPTADGVREAQNRRAEIVLQ